MTEAERNELMQIIRELSYEEREVTLASGRKSNFYFDGKQTCLHARGGLLVGKAFWREIKQFPGPIHGVGGLTLGADPIATATSIAAALDGSERARLHHPQGAQGARHRPVAGGAQEPAGRQPGGDRRGCHHHRRFVDEGGRPRPPGRAGSGRHRHPGRPRGGCAGEYRRGRAVPCGRCSPGPRWWGSNGKSPAGPDLLQGPPISAGPLRRY